jgi:hypothetical protein
MARFYSELNDRLRQFIAEQRVFFVATAPAQGRINLSPKGVDTLRCLDNRTIAYLDLTGSGNETAAHLVENGRITLMWCSFGERPLVLHVYGHGRVVHPRDAEWSRLFPLFEALPGARQFIVLHIESVHTACGFGVPRYEYQGERGTLLEYWAAQGEDAVQANWRETNQVSIDGLPTRLLVD